MKRLVVGLLLAATAYAPIAAGAQRREQMGPVTTDVDRIERQERRAERQERRAARVEASTAVQAPASNVDRPRRDRDGDGRPDRRRDRAETVRPAPVVDQSPRPERVGRPDRGGRRLVRPEDSADFADFADRASDPRDRRADRLDGRRDARQDRLERRRDRPDGDGRFRDGRELDRPDRFDDRRFDELRFRDRRGDRGFDGRSADLYRGGQVWNRGWRNDDRYDWNRARIRNRNAFRLPRYYAPQGAGYGYRRFGVGFQLSRSLFAQDYWLDDPYAFRLPPAYGPYRWVRYHGDALLVDLRTGRVIDVVYDIFY